MTEENKFVAEFTPGETSAIEVLNKFSNEGMTDYIIVGVQLREHAVTHHVEAAQFKTITSLEDLPGIVEMIATKLAEQYAKLSKEKEGR